MYGRPSAASHAELPDRLEDDFCCEVGQRCRGRSSMLAVTSSTRLPEDRHHAPCRTRHHSGTDIDRRRCRCGALWRRANVMLRVVVDPLRLSSYGLSVIDIVERTAASAPFDVPAGSLRSDDQELIVRADASVVTAAQVADDHHSGSDSNQPMSRGSISVLKTRAQFHTSRMDKSVDRPRRHTAGEGKHDCRSRTLCRTAVLKHQ